MTKWPGFIPFDLKSDLERLDSRRDPPSYQDQWGAIKEWLEKHGVEAPERLPVEEEGRGHFGH